MITHTAKYHGLYVPAPAPYHIWLELPWHPNVTSSTFDACMAGDSTNNAQPQNCDIIDITPRNTPVRTLTGPIDFTVLAPAADALLFCFDALTMNEPTRALRRYSKLSIRMFYIRISTI